MAGVRSTRAAILAALFAAFGCAAPHPRPRPSAQAHPSDGAYELSFFNVSDPHIIVPTEKNGWRLTRDSVPILKDTLARISAEKPDLVLLSGDIAEGKFEGMSNLALAVQTLSAEDRPWYVVPGNHDNRYAGSDATLDGYAKDEFIRAFKGHGPDGTVGYWRHDVPRKKVTILGLDTSHEGTSEGWIDDSQKAWLKRTLDEIDPSRYVILVMHHPLVIFDENALRDDRLSRVWLARNADEIRMILEKHRNVKAAISGHMHARGHRLVNGIHYVATPSINTWPCEFTRFSLTRDRLAYEQVDITDAGKIDEAKRGLLEPESDLMKIVADTSTLVGLMSSGPVREDLPLGR
jgi:hypothetical protein